MCTKVRVRALKAIIGDYKAPFGQIRDYLYETYMQNPSTVVKVKTTKVTDDKHVFRFLYICPKSLKRGFLDGCRRVISFDACFPKGPWNGQVFVVVGGDANNQMYLTAWGVAQSEKREVWEWFIALLQEDLEMGVYLTVSVACRGLLRVYKLLCLKLNTECVLGMSMLI